MILKPQTEASILNLRSISQVVVVVVINFLHLPLNYFAQGKVNPIKEDSNYTRVPCSFLRSSAKRMRFLKSDIINFCCVKKKYILTRCRLRPFVLFVTSNLLSHETRQKKEYAILFAFQTVLQHLN